MTPRPKRMFEVVAEWTRNLASISVSGAVGAPQHCQRWQARSVKWGDIPLSWNPIWGKRRQRSALARARPTRFTPIDVMSRRNEAPLKMTFVGAKPAPPIIGEGPQVSPSNYLSATILSSGARPFQLWKGPLRQRRIQDRFCFAGHDGGAEYD